MYLTVTNGLEQIQVDKKKNIKSLGDILKEGKKQIKALFQRGYAFYKEKKIAQQKEKILLKEELAYSKEEEKMTKERRESIKETQKQLEELLSIKKDMTRNISSQNSLSKEQVEKILKLFSSTSVPSQKEMIIRILKQKIIRFKEEDTSKYSFDDYFTRIEDIDSIITKYCRTNDATILKCLEALSNIKRVYLFRMQKQILYFVTKFDNQLERFIPFCKSNCVLEEDIALMNSNYEYIVSKIQKYYFGNEAFGNLFTSIREKVLKINKILIKKEKEQVPEAVQFVKQKVA